MQKQMNSQVETVDGLIEHYKAIRQGLSPTKRVAVSMVIYALEYTRGVMVDYYDGGGGA